MVRLRAAAFLVILRRLAIDPRRIRKGPTSLGLLAAVSAQPGKLLIRPSKAPTRSGSIILPSAAHEKTQEGYVTYVGDHQSPVMIGDLVVFERYDGTRITYDHEELVVLNYDSIMAVIEK